MSVGGEGHEGHTVMDHGGQQQGWGRVRAYKRRQREMTKTQTHMIHPLHDDDNIIIIIIF